MFETLFLRALLLTELVEVPVAVLLARFVLRLKHVPFWKLVLVSFLTSAITLPYLWFVLPTFLNDQWYLPIGEGLVFVVEAFLYWTLLEVNLRDAVILSASANLLSFLVGKLLIG